MFPFIGEGIFTQDGPAWKHSRDLLRRPFLKTHYQDLEGFQEPINNLFSVLSSSTGVVDLQPLFFQFTLATTTSLIFGQSVESSEHDGEDSFGSTFDHASWITTLRSRLGDFYWAYNPSHYKAACDRIKDFADGFIKRALSTDGKDAVGESNGRYAFIRDLYAEYKDPTLVRDQLINILLAGRDTTACLLSWTLYVDLPNLKSSPYPPIPSLTKRPTPQLPPRSPPRRPQPPQSRNQLNNPPKHLHHKIPHPENTLPQKHPQRMCVSPSPSLPLSPLPPTNHLPPH